MELPGTAPANVEIEMRGEDENYDLGNETALVANANMPSVVKLVNQFIGRARVRYNNKFIDLRVSTLPTQYGEKVVMRILDSGKSQIPMEALGLSPANLEVLQSLLSLPQGMFLVTGPTGSGKTSTLYTSLNWVQSPTNNIITVEDPIEYRLAGINQLQINTKAGVTFAAGLRSILRQDPNIIMVGEIRDRETASIAVEASQTGHLLLSTLHKRPSDDYPDDGPGD
jgi:type IV pilus assembly protein PilB